MRLTAFQREKIKKVAKKNGVILAFLFGSQAIGKKRQESDLDIAVLTKNPPSYQLFKNLFTGFSEVFKGENVDLHFLNEADPLFRYQVVKKGELLFGDLKEFNQFKAYAYRSYFDDGRKYFPYLERILEKNQKELEEKGD